MNDKMKNTARFTALLLTLCAGAAVAERGHDYRGYYHAYHNTHRSYDYRNTYVYAEVVAVEPIYGTARAPAAAVDIADGIWMAGAEGYEKVQQQAVAYRVTYRFRDREFETRVDHRPGKWIRISYSPSRYWKM